MCRSIEAIFHYRLVCFYLYFPLKLHHFCFHCQSLHVSICQQDLKTEQIPMKFGGQIGLGQSNNWSDLGGYSDLGFLSRCLVSFLTCQTVCCDESTSGSRVSSLVVKFYVSCILYMQWSLCVLQFNKWLPLRAGLWKCCRICAADASSQTHRRSMSSRVLQHARTHGNLRFKNLVLIRKVSDWVNWPGNVEAAAWKQLIWTTSELQIKVIHVSFPTETNGCYSGGQGKARKK